MTGFEYSDRPRTRTDALTKRSGDQGRDAGSKRVGNSPEQQGFGPEGGDVLEDVFDRLDRDNSGSVDRKELIDHLKNVGIGGGLFGMVHKKVANGFMEKLDVIDKDKRVTWEEFRGAASLIPDSLLDDNGRVSRELVERTFREADTGGDFERPDEFLDLKELHAYTLSMLPQDESHRNTKADVAAKLAADALDTDGDGRISLAELQHVADMADQVRGKEQVGE